MSMQKGLLVHPDELGEGWIHRLRGSGVNLFGLHPVGGRKAFETIDSLRREMLEGKYDAALAKIREMGIHVEFEAHTASFLVPRELFAEHPDWFRMNEQRERVPDFNFCPSSTEALALAGKRAAELAAALPSDTHRYHFWIDDVRNSHCHCPKCAGLSPSDQALIIYNALLTAIRTVDPLATHCYLAYCDTMEVPQKVAPQEGIFLEYAPFDRDFKKPLADHNERCEHEFAALRKLLDFFGTANAKVLEYWLDNSLFSKWKKPPQPFTLDPAVLDADLALYRGLGFECITTFACYLGPDYVALYGEPDIAAYLKP